jgi:hypothetical protein
MAEQEVRELVEKAFFIGFSVSREGFNGECTYDHLAPRELESDHEIRVAVSADAEGCLENDPLRALCDQAIAAVMGGKPPALPSREAWLLAGFKQEGFEPGGCFRWKWASTHTLRGTTIKEAVDAAMLDELDAGLSTDTP